MTQEIVISDTHTSTLPRDVVESLHGEVDESFVWTEETQLIDDFDEETGEPIYKDEWVTSYKDDIPRDHPQLVEAIKEADAEWKVVEIPDDVEWVIQDYDGLEWVAERHRTWPHKNDWEFHITGPSDIDQ